LLGLLNGNDPLLRQEAVRTLNWRRAAPLLVPFAADAMHDRQPGRALVDSRRRPVGEPGPKLLAELLASDDALASTCSSAGWSPTIRRRAVSWQLKRRPPRQTATAN
jgi:hypothetical protein